MNYSFLACVGSFKKEPKLTDQSKIIIFKSPQSSPNASPPPLLPPLFISYEGGCQLKKISP
uniref:Uncharacterized protein n=1 Tax=Anguilla anguilla TaxID=7936 RepID=A0A0E9UHJ7_ANGAN